MKLQVQVLMVGVIGLLTNSEHNSWVAEADIKGVVVANFWRQFSEREKKLNGRVEEGSGIEKGGGGAAQGNTKSSENLFD